MHISHSSIHNLLYGMAATIHCHSLSQQLSFGLSGNCLNKALITNSQFPILRTIFYLLLLTGLWVFLSGVGGYAFQNWDHHWRNAVLHDLITYNWPVVYSSPEKGPITMLVYYVGYWLPAALAGKIFGWQAANFVLFLWTWLGVFLVISHLSLKLKTTALKAALLLIFFSGMDALGVLLFANEYPTLWPPIQHLEIWSGNLQYSSFTTQLFWVFNQVIPAWLCMCSYSGVWQLAVRTLRSKLLDSKVKRYLFGHSAFSSPHLPQ